MASGVGMNRCKVGLVDARRGCAPAGSYRLSPTRAPRGKRAARAFIMVAASHGSRMQSLGASRTAVLLPWPALVDALRDMLRRRHAGLPASPERLVVPLPGGILLAMPATDSEYASTKLVTVHEGNAARGLPVLLGEVLLMRADTGERLLMLDGPTVTARRTAAMSALAAIERGAARLAAPGGGPAGSASANGPSLLSVGSRVAAEGARAAVTQALGL